MQQQGKQTLTPPPTSQRAIQLLSAAYHKWKSTTPGNRQSKGDSDSERWLSSRLWHRCRGMTLPSVTGAYIGKSNTKSCRGVRRNQSWSTPPTAEKSTRKYERTIRTTARVKSPDPLLLILPETCCGVSEFSGDHFIYFSTFLLTKVFYICFVLQFNCVLKKPTTNCLPLNPWDVKTTAGEGISPVWGTEWAAAWKSEPNPRIWMKSILPLLKFWPVLLFPLLVPHRIISGLLRQRKINYKIVEGFYWKGRESHCLPHTEQSTRFVPKTWRQEFYRRTKVSRISKTFSFSDFPSCSSLPPIQFSLP